ncbi:MAG TPA: hypothetical protein VJ777_04715 [Mycobacterium sp.]|nr:hypothetical protein [Mycobacterium sp.]
MWEEIQKELARSAGAVVTMVVTRIPQVVRDRNTAPSSVAEASVERHLSYVANWSARDQFFGMSSARDVDVSTTPLAYTEMPRKFRGTRDVDRTLDEQAILAERTHHLILGDPGAGKTTTVKRLCRRVLTNPPQASTDDWQLPLLLVLRELPNSFSLSEKLMEILGIPGLTFDNSMRPQEGLKPLDGETERQYRARRDKEKALHDEWLEAESAERRGRAEALYAALDRTGAIVFLDGLDEMPEAQRLELEKELVGIAQKLSSAKFVASCRSGAYTRTLESFDILEIAPLDRQQAEDIIVHYVSDPRAFWIEMERCQLTELADRPLFLTQLAVLFDNSGSLPERPTVVYERIVDLLLRRWDLDHRVIRKSGYAQFAVEDKRDFLAQVSHYLTCRIRTKRFSEEQMLEAFADARGRFSLPRDQGPEVVAEIETHTGLIVQSGYGAYEFSHLVLQEYLCAEYLIRDPLRHRLPTYIRDYPEPVAVAVALSSDPTRYLADILLEHSATTPAVSLANLLNRIAIERPRLEESPVLGIALVKLLESYTSQLARPLERFLALPFMGETLSLGLRYYRLHDTGTLTVRMKLVTEVLQSVGVARPPVEIVLERFAVAALDSWGYWPGGMNAERTTKVPADIEEALLSRLPSVRSAVIEDICALIDHGPPSLVQAARDALARLATDDDQRVRDLAESALVERSIGY